MSENPVDLEVIFRAVGGTLGSRQADLNQMDEVNHNHGDHMVEIFNLASQAALEKQSAPLADAMKRAAELLSARANNGSAQVYGRGMTLLSEQFRQRQIELGDLLSVIGRHLGGEPEAAEEESTASGEVTKALLNALAEWEKVEDSQAAGAAGKAGGLDMGYLFGVGMAYLQAKQKGGDRLDVLSETVVSASPLGKVAYRHASGVIAVRALLEAMKA